MYDSLVYCIFEIKAFYSLFCSFECRETKQSNANTIPLLAIERGRATVSQLP